MVMMILDDGIPWDGGTDSIDEQTARFDLRFLFYNLIVGARCTACTIVPSVHGCLNAWPIVAGVLCMGLSI
jgi:hypothetical protein